MKESRVEGQGSGQESRVKGQEWPDLALDGWRETYETLHMWAQVVGKVALALAPPLNHAWSSALQVTPRGCSTRILPYGARTFTIEFDFIDHQLVVRVSDGTVRSLPLEPRTVADFYRRVMSMLHEIDVPVKIWSLPAELPSPIRFEEDVMHTSYDGASANRFWQIVLRTTDVMSRARSSFVGKCSPVHFFWGAFDLACTRFSGRVAPPREGPAFMREAYSHEVISHGFWPGNAQLPEPVFYSYAAPEPDGFKEARIEPDGAYYHRELGEFILPYARVRAAPDPARALRAFIDSTYDRAATLARWDRAALENPALAS